MTWRQMITVTLVVAFLAGLTAIIQSALAQQNRAIVFAACRAYHRRDLLDAKAANDRVALEHQWVAHHRGMSLGKMALPIDEERNRTAHFIVHFDCLSGMMKAEHEAP